MLGFDAPVLASEVAGQIGSRLAKAALVRLDDGALLDMSHSVSSSCSIEFITADSEEGLDIIRHSTAFIGSSR